MKSKFVGDEGEEENDGGGSRDEAVLKEFNGFKRKLNERFKYAKIFKDEAVLQREQDEKRKEQEERLLEQSQRAVEENNGGGGGVGGTTTEMATMLDDLTIGGGGGGAVAVHN